MTVIVIIPAGLSSLLKLKEKTILQYAHEQTSKINPKQIIIATHDERVVQVAQKFSANTHLTLQNKLGVMNHLIEVTESQNLSEDTLVLHYPCNRPFIPINFIEEIIQTVESSQNNATIATLSIAMTETENLLNSDRIKVVTGYQGKALYFHRAPLPTQSPQSTYQENVELYACRIAALRQFSQWKPSPLEALENIEWMRFLWYEEAIQVIPTDSLPPRIQTSHDLAEASLYLNNSIQTH